MNVLPQSGLAWTTNVDKQLIYTAALVIVIFAAVRLGEWAAHRTVTDERWRYTIRKLIRYTAISVLLVTTLGIWAQRLQGLLLVLGAKGGRLGPSRWPRSLPVWPAGGSSSPRICIRSGIWCSWVE